MSKVFPTGIFYTIGFYIFFFGFIISLGVMYAFVVERKIEKVVKKSSFRYKKIVEINKKYPFWRDIAKEYVFSKKFGVKQQFDKFENTNFFEKAIENHFDEIEKVIVMVKDNRICLEQYQKEIDSIKPVEIKKDARVCKIPFFIFKRVENKLVDKVRNKSKTEPIFICETSYTSYPESNYFEKKEMFNYEELEKHFNVVKTKICSRGKLQYYHQVSTEFLKFDIFKNNK